jgi:signal transduction histidine kinase
MGDFEPLSHSLTVVATAVGEQRRSFAEAGQKLAAEAEARTTQLRSANEQLREIDRRRGQFLADVSHELRTPLTILRGEADVALRGTSDAAILRASLERIQGQASELGQLLEDLLEFARSTAEDQPFVMADTPLDEVVAAAAQEARMLASPREVTVAVAPGTDGRHIDADFRRLKQALIIGLDNAIKHSPPGTTVTVETASEEQSVRISIADEGAGVDEADLPRVFERFFRGKDQEDSLSSGLGIGLAIAKDIVERHGGTIGLSNRPEGGAMLSIVLPAGERTA